MITKELAAYHGLPEDAKPALLALAVLMDRIGSLPKPDRDCLFELVQAWPKAEDDQERQNIRRRWKKILAQVPIKVRRLAHTDEQISARSTKNWAQHVGKTIRMLREKSGMTQTEAGF